MTKFTWRWRSIHCCHLRLMSLSSDQPLLLNNIVKCICVASTIGILTRTFIAIYSRYLVGAPWKCGVFCRFLSNFRFFFPLQTWCLCRKNPSMAQWNQRCSRIAASAICTDCTATFQWSPAIIQSVGSFFTHHAWKNGFQLIERAKHSWMWRQAIAHRAKRNCPHHLFNSLKSDWKLRIWTYFDRNFMSTSSFPSSTIKNHML